MRLDRIVAALMVLTGFCSFGYELVLHYEAVLILGSSNITMGLIISMFIFGYLSSFWFGKHVDKLKDVKKIVLLFCVLEVAIGLILLFIVPLTRLVPYLADYLSYISIFFFLEEHYLMLIMISILALIIPLLMGGEIPIAMKIISSTKGSKFKGIGTISGLVFAMDSFGAGMGGIITALILIPTFGQTTTAILLACVCLTTATTLMVSYIVTSHPLLKKHILRVSKKKKDAKELKESKKDEEEKEQEKTERKKKIGMQNIRRFNRKITTILWEYKIAVIIIIFGILAVSTVYLNADEMEYYTIQKNYQDQVVFYKYSPYQQIVITENSELGYMMYLNGQLQIAEGDEYQYHEPLVQVPLTTHPDPKRVLIIGGGDGGALEEVLKQDTVSEVVMIELDYEVVAVSKKYFNSVHKNAYDDERATIKYMKGEVDCVIIIPSGAKILLTLS